MSSAPRVTRCFVSLENASIATPPPGWQLNNVWTGMLECDYKQDYGLIQKQKKLKIYMQNWELPRVGVPYYNCAVWPLVCCCNPTSVFAYTHTWDGVAVTLKRWCIQYLNWHCMLLLRYLTLKDAFIIYSLGRLVYLKCVLGVWGVIVYDPNMSSSIEDHQLIVVL